MEYKPSTTVREAEEHGWIPELEFRQMNLNKGYHIVCGFQQKCRHPLEDEPRWFALNMVDRDLDNYFR